MDFVKSLVLCLMLLVPSICFADYYDDDDDDDGGIEIAVGITAMYGSSEYRGVDTDWDGFGGYKGPLPTIMIDSRFFFLMGFDEAGIHVFQNEMFELDVIVGMLDGFDPEDSNDWAVNQMKKRKDSMFAGLRGSIETPVGIFGASFVGDVLGNSHSLLAEISYEYPLMMFMPKLMLVPSVSLEWANDKHNDYYYGVSGSESIRSGLNKYEAGAGFTPSVELMATYFITENIAVILEGSYSILSSEVKNSPIVDRNNVWSVMGSVMYMF